MEAFIDGLRRSDFRIVGRFARGFIILQVKGSLFLLDQHAIHERARLEMLETALQDGQGLHALSRTDAMCIQSLWARDIKGDEALEQLKMRACKGSIAWRGERGISPPLGAIKITDAVDDGQLRAILHQLSHCRFPFICAHGRPCLTVISDARVNGART